VDKPKWGVKMVVTPIAELSEELDQLQAVHRHGYKSTRILITFIIGLFGDRAQPGDDRCLAGEHNRDGRADARALGITQSALTPPVPHRHDKEAFARLGSPRRRQGRRSARELDELKICLLVVAPVSPDRSRPVG
jgi:hypothetical protein